jgi:hypothetical protein
MIKMYVAPYGMLSSFGYGIILQCGLFFEVLANRLLLKIRVYNVHLVRGLMFESNECATC